MTNTQMHAEEQRLLELLDLSCDGRLTASGAIELHELLGRDLLYFQVCVQYFDMHTELVHYAVKPLTPNELCEAISREPLSERRRTRRIFWAGVASLALGLLVVAWLTLGLQGISGEPVAQTQPTDTPREPGIVPVPLARIQSVVRGTAWNGNSRSLGEVLHRGDQIGLMSGRILIEFTSGVQLQFQGPGAFRIDSPLLVRLFQGEALANVPPAGTGFTIRSGDAEMVDYGTEFLVQASPHRPTTVSVRKGQIGIGFGSAPMLEQHELMAGNAVRVDDHDKAISHAAYDSEAYLPFDLDRADISGLSGRIRYVLEPRPTFPVKFGTPIHEAWLLKEVSQRVFAHSLSFNDFMGPVTIEQGVPVDSFILHFSPTGKPTSRIQGGITFEQEILGVVCQSENLGMTDEMLGLATKDPNDKSRGLDSTSDRVQVSPDRHTLSFNILTANGFTDQIRILVESVQGIRPLE